MGTNALATTADLEMNDYDFKDADTKIGGSNEVNDQGSEKSLTGNGPPENKIGVKTQWKITRE